MLAKFYSLQVHDLLKLYSEVNVPPERLLFKIPSTWQVSIWGVFALVGTGGNFGTVLS